MLTLESLSGERIRRIARNGGVIDAGDGYVWDARFMDDAVFNKLEDDFGLCMWPFNRVVARHLFPWSDGFHPSVESVVESGTFALELVGADPRLGNDHCLALRIKDRRIRRMTIPLWCYTRIFDPTRGDTLVEERQERDGELVGKYPYGEPVSVGVGHWIPSSCEFGAYGKGGSRLSTLMTEVVPEACAIGVPPSDEELAIAPWDPEKFIRWRKDRSDYKSDVYFLARQEQSVPREYARELLLNNWGVKGALLALCVALVVFAVVAARWRRGGRRTKSNSA
ncbi:MAG: hypothetical protein GY851_01915 [bacterium]|nr:hypothetical protein [bacterium]